MTDQAMLEQAAGEVHEVHKHLQGLAERISEYGSASARMKDISDSLAGVGQVLKESHEALAVFIAQTRELKQKSHEIQKVQAGILEEMPVLLRHLQTAGVPKALVELSQEVSLLTHNLESQSKLLVDVQNGFIKIQPRMDRIESNVVDRVKASEQVVSEILTTLETATNASSNSMIEVQSSISKMQLRMDHIELNLVDRVAASEKLLSEGLGTIEKSTDTSKDLLMEVLKTLGAMRRDLQDVKTQGSENSAKIHLLSKRRGFIW